MIDGIKLMQNENGEWAKYDDTYDVVIHCESAEEQERAINILKDRQWISVRERLPECGVRSACSSSAAGTISRRCDIRGGRAG